MHFLEQQHGYGKREKRQSMEKKMRMKKRGGGLECIVVHHVVGDRCSIDEFIGVERAIRLKLKIRREGKFISARDAFGNCSSPVLHLSPSLIIPPCWYLCHSTSSRAFLFVFVQSTFGSVRLFVNSKKLFTFKVLWYSPRNKVFVNIKNLKDNFHFQNYYFVVIIIYR